MQCLYASESESGAMPAENILKLLKKYLDQTSDLYIFTVYFLTEVARYAETDAKNRASKHLPSYEDLHVNVKLAGNTLLWSILEAKGFKSAVEERGLDQYLEQETVRKIYQKLVDTPQYQEYILMEGRDKKSEKELLSFIFTDLIMADEQVTEMIEEHFVQWDDDADMIYQMVLNLLSKPNSCSFTEIIGPEKTRYAKSLLQTVMEKKEMTMELIKPKLKNWDPERIAVLDMIMIRMGVCELLFFETIPVKVTINEYIDLGKSYSTNQSGHFINGILDSIHKDLLATGRLDKVDFKKNKGN
jgi:transcription antitermination protein NusB